MTRAKRAGVRSVRHRNHSRAVRNHQKSSGNFNAREGTKSALVAKVGAVEADPLVARRAAADNVQRARAAAAEEPQRVLRNRWPCADTAQA